MWKETLKIRVSQADAGQKGDAFWGLFQLTELPPGLTDYSVYTNAAHQNEVMLELHWETFHPCPGGSRLARSLAARLKSHGMVSLSVWRRNPLLGAGKR